ncbi:hypothetical protein, partial [Rhodococcus rhodochrous]|uniref:hypothetical protein n=1 Tax=Rhodococcus rhodochrous TaxID=1829 RepID=UPI0018E1A0D7
ANSDLDYLLIGDVDGAADPLLKLRDRVVDDLSSKMVDDVKLSKPGASGIFGEIVRPAGIVKNIGLDADTNITTTRRLLLLEESVSLLSPNSHRQLLRDILQRYLELRKPNSRRVPRVLLNDIIRYWRTLAVDYHAKSSPPHPPYSLRYLKLVIPRQLCFVSSIAPLFLLSMNDSDDIDETEFLLEAFTQPAMLRLANLFSAICSGEYSDGDEVQATACSVFSTLDHFVERSG